MNKPTSDQIQAEYEVGYGKPPRATQFKPGQSGNRKGRPKESQNFLTVLKNELNSQVVLTESGRRKQVRKQVVIVKQLVNKAAGGDLKAASLVMAEVRGMEAASAASQVPTAPQEFAHADKMALQSIAARIRAIERDVDNANLAPNSPAATDQSPPAPTDTSAAPEPQPGVSS